jgi:peptidoglycan hydrolase-like protein with peptidoglycan-binding domain
MLAALGYYGGTVDGRFGSSTVAAVKAWQKRNGLQQDGVVQSGDIIFVPTLPIRLSLDTEKLFRGAILSGGEQVLNSLPSAPSFAIPVTSKQAISMPIGTQVEISGPNGEAWSAQVVDQQVGESDFVSLVLGSSDEVPLCADSCDGISVADKTYLTAKIVTVPTEKGLVVPSAALLTEATGSVFVVDEAGKKLSVSVGTSARGMSVIEGVEAGTRVRVPVNAS